MLFRPFPQTLEVSTRLTVSEVRDRVPFSGDPKIRHDIRFGSTHHDLAQHVNAVIDVADDDLRIIAKRLPNMTMCVLRVVVVVVPQRLAKEVDTVELMESLHVCDVALVRSRAWDGCQIYVVLGEREFGSCFFWDEEWVI